MSKDKESEFYTEKAFTELLAYSNCNDTIRFSEAGDSVRCGKRDAIELTSSVVRDHHGRSSFVDGPTRIVTGQDTLYHDRAVPMIADPTQIFPTDSGTR